MIVTVVAELPEPEILYALRSCAALNPAGSGLGCGQPRLSVITRPWQCTHSGSVLTLHVDALLAVATSCAVICVSGPRSSYVHADATSAITKGTTSNTLRAVCDVAFMVGQ